MSFPMNMIFGDQTGGESPKVRNLRKIDSGKYNQEFVQNIAGLNSATDYMAQYLIVMQKGVDEANKNIIQKIQDFIADLIIIFTGGSDTGFEFGDLEYIVQALGALFGFQGMSGPINLLEAAVHFLTNFLMPSTEWGDALDNPVKAAFLMLAELLEMIPFVGETLSELVENIADGLNTTHSTATTAQTNTATIATGVTGNVTGSNATSEPGYVGSAVAILNSALAGATSAPQVNIYNANATWSKPAGCLNMDIHVIAASGNAAAGGSYFGGSGSGGGGGGGGGYSKSLALAASSVTATVAVTVGTTAGASSSYGSYVSATGGGNGATNGTVGANGTGNQTVNVSGGRGGFYSGFGTQNNATAGNAGPYSAGGAAGVKASVGGAGGPGVSPPSGSYGPGSGGGGGALGTVNAGGPGGDGGFPGGGPGGGGSSGNTGSSGGAAGAFKAGQVIVISYF